MPKKSCSRVQIVRRYRLHCPLEDMSLLQRMNHIFTFIDSVLFKRKQEVLRERDRLIPGDQFSPTLGIIRAGWG